MLNERSPSDLITLVHVNKQFNNVNTQTAARIVTALMYECANSSMTLMQEEEMMPLHIVLDNTSLQHSRGQNITMEAQFEEMFYYCKGTHLIIRLIKIVIIHVIT